MVEQITAVCNLMVKEFVTDRVKDANNTSTETSNTIFGYPLYQVWSAIDTPGRLITSPTHGRTRPR
jgi:hypothetical protein